MTRSAPTTALAAALLVTLAIAGCKQQADTTAATPPASDAAAEPAAAPDKPEPAATMPAPLMVTTVDLGNAVGADNRVSAPLTTFATTDTIHASVATDGGSADTLTAKWTYEDGQVVDTTEKSIAAGPQVTEFSISKPGGWPTGKYKLEIQQNGVTVQSRDFEVR